MYNQIIIICNIPQFVMDECIIGNSENRAIINAENTVLKRDLELSRQLFIDGTFISSFPLPNQNNI